MKMKLEQLEKSLDGDLHFDQLMRHLYATDASVYRELPLAVALPRTTADIKTLIRFAKEHKTSLIPRAAGTSLAGQCVGDGIVVDISRYMNQIIELNVEERWVRVQPGVIRDELNHYLEPYGLFFGPNTSTANRCMIGGMVGNNSCGTTSIVYGSTRDHVIELKTLLSDGSEAIFHALSPEAFNEKTQGAQLENAVYRQIRQLLSDSENQKEIREQFPKPELHRRNTGYAVDLLLHQKPFKADGSDFNFCELLCGSEGTLAFTTEIKLNLDPLPPAHAVVVCAHFTSIQASLEAVLDAMEVKPFHCELMDKTILDLTKSNIEQQKNRFFVEGDPEGILMVEFREESPEKVEQKADQFIDALKAKGSGYAFPKVYHPRIKQAWTLRNAGLGILANLPGDAKTVPCIEDTAVDIQDLPAYIAEFTALMDRFNQKAVYYAHAGAGELHLRPILNLKKAEDQELFYQITEGVAHLVKKYRGSLSGEHGDGRVRAGFIPLMIGQKNYELLRRIKQTWDPDHIFNPGKIVDAPPMKESLRFEAGQPTPDFDTVFDYSDTQGFYRMVEKCNGSGDCRKLPIAGGTMCPSYQATRNEKDTTRGRANALREFLRMDKAGNPFAHPELMEVMDLCISCKGCTSECPSNVDMATLKAEFLYQYYRSNKPSLRTRAMANIDQLNRLASTVPGLSNFFLSNPVSGQLIRRTLKIAQQRSLPPLSKVSLKKWCSRHLVSTPITKPLKGKVWLFCDEFSNYNDAEIGIAAVGLLHALGYQVMVCEHPGSGRAHLSKGLLEEARQLAIDNVRCFKDKVSQETPLIGLEPSAILGFRDEYPRIVREEDREAARQLGQQALLLEEFLVRELEKGKIGPEQFTTEPAHILLHGHCHQKALSSTDVSAWTLGIPQNYSVEVIPSGCCGMAGSFGYEEEHYEISMKIGELVLFPAVRAAAEATIVAAPGTSCRHQIHDGTGRTALHPAIILYNALKKN